MIVRFRGETSSPPIGWAAEESVSNDGSYMFAEAEAGPASTTIGTGIQLCYLEAALDRWRMGDIGFDVTVASSDKKRLSRHWPGTSSWTCPTGAMSGTTHGASNVDVNCEA